MEFGGSLWDHAALHRLRYMETISLLHLHTVPLGSADAGRSCPSDLLPSLCYQGWTWCSFSLLTLASCSKHLGELMVPQSSILDFGQPCLLLLHPPPLLLNLTIPALSLMVRLHLHLLYCLPLHLLYQSLIPRSQGCLVPLVERVEVPLRLQ